MVLDVLRRSASVRRFPKTNYGFLGMKLCFYTLRYNATFGIFNEKVMEMNKEMYLAMGRRAARRAMRGRERVISSV